MSVQTRSVGTEHTDGHFGFLKVVLNTAVPCSACSAPVKKTNQQQEARGAQGAVIVHGSAVCSAWLQGVGVWLEPLAVLGPRCMLWTREQTDRRSVGTADAHTRQPRLQGEHGPHTWRRHGQGKRGSHVCLPHVAVMLTGGPWLPHVVATQAGERRLPQAVVMLAGGTWLPQEWSRSQGGCGSHVWRPHVALTRAEGRWLWSCHCSPLSPSPWSPRRHR